MSDSEPSPAMSQATATTDGAPIGVIGGSGFYSFLESAREVEARTPFGEPSDPITIGEVSGRAVAFLPRHGRDHRFPPHQVNYRANLWALRSLGVRQVLAPCAVGSLIVDNGPGTLVVPDQVVDRTWGRPSTVYDGTVYDGAVDDGTGPVVHIPFADPYCARGRRVVLDVASAEGEHVVDGGTLVVVNGPRFSTRAESRWHAASGWAVVGMTGMPEASIARELAICYTTIALVTDHDAGIESGEGVTHHEVLEVFGRNVQRLKSLLSLVVAQLPNDDACACRHALDGQRLPFDLP